MKRFGDLIPTVCGVCKREAGATAVGDISLSRSGSPKPRLWHCGSAECATLAHKVLTMPVRDLSSLEAISLADAGDAAGAYLVGLDKTDLGDLSPEQWLTFLKTILTTYEAQMRQRLSVRLGKAAA